VPPPSPPQPEPEPQPKPQPSMEELPDLSPMLATPGPLPHGDAWVHEIKWDGIRALIAVSANAITPVRITTRLGNDATPAFPDLAAFTVPDVSALLDGEIVAFAADGKPSFNRLQMRLGLSGANAEMRSREIPVVFAAFDLLHLNGISTRSLPWHQRRSLLERIWPGDGPSWRLPATHDDGDALLTATRQADLEGVVSKKRDSTYTPGRRSPNWVKVKNLQIDEFVIGGWTVGERSRADTLGALLIGMPESDAPNARLVWHGKVGTGFDGAELAKLTTLLRTYARVTTPFTGPTEAGARFVEPVLRCRVEYREYTPDRILRFPSYKGLITD
jgi:bifunctional non-homologous end joining protein LigD